MALRDFINFISFLQTHRRGRVLQEADSMMRTVIAEVRRTGKAGSVTVKLPFKLNKGGQIECEPEVTSKVPTKSIGVGVYYATDEGELTRRDPDQMDLEDDEFASRRNAAE